jgi:kynurenine formamidase
MSKSKTAALVWTAFSVLLVSGGVISNAACSAPHGKASLWEIYEKEIKPRQFVDLTHSFSSAIPRWPGFSAEERKTIYTYEKDGFFAELFTHVGQYGTHCDPPGHFHKGLRMIDEISVKEMVLPLVVIDCSRKVAADPDYQLVLADLTAWEGRHGRIPAGSFVAMRSDWSRRFSDFDAFYNKDASGQAHYPGWTIEALKFLFDERGITAIGHEPIDADAAVAQKEGFFSCESYVLKTNRFQVELIANLDQVPEAGALVICSWPKPKSGSGFPARVFAILP